MPVPPSRCYAGEISDVSPLSEITPLADTTPREKAPGSRVEGYTPDHTPLYSIHNAVHSVLYYY